MFIFTYLVKKKITIEICKKLLSYNMKNIISIINILKKTQKINLKKLLFYLIYYLNSFDLKESTRMIKLLIKYWKTIWNFI